MEVYLVRCLKAHLSTALNHAGVVKHGPVQNETKNGAGRERVASGYQLVRLVLDGSPPQPAPPGTTWRRIGSTGSPFAPTYTPLERCMRGHAPLRYLCNGGCVYCARSAKGVRPRLKLQVPVECAEGLAETVAAMGWTLERKRGEAHGRILVGVTASVSEAEAVATCRGLGWEVSLWK